MCVKITIYIYIFHVRVSIFKCNNTVLLSIITSFLQNRKMRTNQSKEHRRRKKSCSLSLPFFRPRGDLICIRLWLLLQLVDDCSAIPVGPFSSLPRSSSTMGMHVMFMSMIATTLRIGVRRVLVGGFIKSLGFVVDTTY